MKSTLLLLIVFLFLDNFIFSSRPALANNQTPLPSPIPPSPSSQPSITPSPVVSPLPSSSPSPSSLPSPGSNYLVYVVFISDGYTQDQLNLFHQTVDIFKNHLLTYEPFKSRQSQFDFKTVDNLESLNCYILGETNNILVCDKSKTEQIIRNSGIINIHIMVVIKNWNLYAQSGLPEFVTITNYGNHSDAFVHEFGHSFAYLRDEYNYNRTGSITGTVDKNCYQGTPPALEWQNLVGTKDYQQVCGYTNYYRSSEYSIMSLDGYYFNAVSQKILNERVDFYAGPFMNAVAPTNVNITWPADKEVISGQVSIVASASDDQGVSYVQLWRNNELFITAYEAPYQFYWATMDDPDGNYTLQVKAYDVVGNTSGSSPITVTVNNGSPIPTAAPSPSSTCLGPADFDCNGVIDMDDVKFILSNWLTNNDIADINNDGLVNAIDFHWVIKDWP